MHSTIQDEKTFGTACLAFRYASGDHVGIARSMGYEISPYFWGSLLEYIAPDLTETVTFSYHDDYLEAHGYRDVVELLQAELEPYLEDAKKLETLLDEAEADGYDLAHLPS